MSEVRELLTILVTTYNRYTRLQRLLRYWRRVPTGCPVVILDSSSDAIDPSIPAACAELGAQLTRFAPSTPPMEKMCAGLAGVTTPYAVFWADDDFLVPESLREAVRFLESHDDRVAVHGEAALFMTGQPDQPGSVACMPYRQRSLTDATAAERIADHFQYYSVLNYATHRTAALRRHVELCAAHGFGYAWGELALGGLSAASGRVTKLPGLYLLKETHADMDSWNPVGHRLTVCDWMTGRSFAEQYPAFCECLGQAVAERDGLSLDDGRRLVRVALWTYLAGQINTEIRDAVAPSTGRRRAHAWRSWLAKIPGLRALRRALRDAEPANMTTAGMLRPRSPYHDAFAPVWYAIAKSVEPVRMAQSIDEQTTAVAR